MLFGFKGGNGSAEGSAARHVSFWPSVGMYCHSFWVSRSHTIAAHMNTATNNLDEPLVVAKNELVVLEDSCDGSSPSLVSCGERHESGEVEVG